MNVNEEIKAIAKVLEELQSRLLSLTETEESLNTAPAMPEVPVGPVHNIDDLRKLMAVQITKSAENKDAIKSILAQHGASKLSNLSTSFYDAVYTEVSCLDNMPF